LKTLEEPPGRTTFVLLSHDPRQLLPTVLSRCVTVHFPRLTAAEIEEALVRDYGVEAEEAAEAAARADGTLAGAAAAAGGEDAAALESALAVLEVVAAGGVAEALAAAQGTRGREDALALVNALAEVNHDLAAIRAGAAETVRSSRGDGWRRRNGCGRGWRGLRSRCATTATLRSRSRNSSSGCCPDGIVAEKTRRADTVGPSF
jgi:hypothetical protein